MTVGEKLRRKCSAFMFSDCASHHPDNQKLLKKILAGCRSCGKCRLPLTEYVCPETCPKRIANGCCGGVSPDGSCKLLKRECIHSKIVRLAYQGNRMSELNETIIPPVNE